MNHQEEQQFYKLLRLSLGLTQEFPVDVDADGWRRLYQTARFALVMQLAHIQRHFLSDTTGTRRWQPFEMESIESPLTRASGTSDGDGYLFRVLQNSKITYRPHCPGTGGGAFFMSNF